MTTVLYAHKTIHWARQREKLSGVMRYAAALGWNVVPIDREKEGVGAVRKALRKRSFDGCIVEWLMNGERLPPKFFGGIPVVYLDPAATPPWAGARHVVCDNASVARTAFHELSLSKPKAYAVVMSALVLPWAEERAAAFAAACRAAGAPCHAFGGLLASGCGKAPAAAETRKAALAAWVAGLPAHTAVFAVNDKASIEVAEAARATHRAIPRELSLIGVDDIELLCENATPPISSIRLDFENAGFLAAKMLAETLRAGAAARLAPQPPPALFPSLLAQRRRSTGGRGRIAPHIATAVAIIRREASNGLTPASLKRMVPGSRRLLELRFREATGRSMLDEILHVRLEKAFALLSDRRIAISAIAELCGFGCGYDLRRLFRLRTGMSMRTWREHHSR